MMNEVIKWIEEISEAKGKEKEKIIKEHYTNKEFCQILYYALNPMLTYKVSEKTLRGLCTVPYDQKENFASIFEICEKLNSVKAVNAELLAEVNNYMRSCSAYETEFYIKLLSKTLKIGVTAKTVNKIIPNLIPEWEVQQAYPIDKYPIKPETEFTLTQKLNGVRATYYNGKLYARSGEVYEGLDHITEALADIDCCLYDESVFDGELTLKDKNGLSDNEAFRIATGIINSDSKSKIEIQFTVFDIIPKIEFEKEDMISRTPYKTRRAMIDYCINCEYGGDYVNFLPALYRGTDQNMITILLNQMVEEDKEGLMLNLDYSPYYRKRHKGILKVKRFYTMDLPIVDMEEGTGKLKGTLGALVVDYKGNTVNVGTGLDDATREEIWNNKENYIGKLCEVKYKEISYDKKSKKESLQFPVFISIRKDKNTVSYA